jgi:hypothetical protein
MRIEIKCKGEAEIPIKSIKEFQGDLKELNPINYGKLRQAILKLGFSEPLSIWNYKGTNYILNGHQRLKAVKKMSDEGIGVPKNIPINFIQAKNIKEAKLKVLSLTSQFGKFNKAEVLTFLEENKIEIEEYNKMFSLTGINIAKIQIQNERTEITNVLTTDLDTDYGKNQVIIIEFDSPEAVEKTKKHFKTNTKIIEGTKLIKLCS